MSNKKRKLDYFSIIIVSLFGGSSIVTVSKMIMMLPSFKEEDLAKWNYLGVTGITLGVVGFLVLTTYKGYKKKKTLQKGATRRTSAHNKH